MELQSYITENTDYLSKFKEHKLYVRKNKQLGLCIVKCHYDRTYDYKSNPWMKYCRGAVIDILKNKLVCIPPQKAVDTYLIDIPEMLYNPPNKVIGKLQDVIDNYSEEYTYEPLFDGTMVNMFYHNDEWMISTRSNIGAKNSWDGKKSFLKMFLEVHGDAWFTELKKDHCYSFILHHINNRNVSPIETNAIFLVENHQITENDIKKVKLHEIKNILTIFQLSKEMLEGYKQNIVFSIKGFTIKSEDERVNWINPNFEYVKTLKMNHNNKYLNYISLKQKRLLSQYLSYFPEDRFLFDEYRDEFNMIKIKLYERYVSRFIRKNIETKDIEYPLKPLIYELHGSYLKSKEKINLKIVSDYLHHLDGKKIMFIRNYLFGDRRL